MACSKVKSILRGCIIDAPFVLLVRERMVDWQDYVHADPKVLVGKPVVKGTRLSVDFVLGLFAAGWTEQQVLENYPTLTPEGLRAVFAFAAELAREERMYTLPLEKG